MAQRRVQTRLEGAAHLAGRRRVHSPPRPALNTGRDPPTAVSRPPCRSRRPAPTRWQSRHLQHCRPQIGRRSCLPASNRRGGLQRPRRLLAWLRASGQRRYTHERAGRAGQGRETPAQRVMAGWRVGAAAPPRMSCTTARGRYRARIAIKYSTHCQWCLHRAPRLIHAGGPCRGRALIRARRAAGVGAAGTAADDGLAPLHESQSALAVARASPQTCELAVRHIGAPVLAGRGPSAPGRARPSRPCGAFLC